MLFNRGEAHQRVPTENVLGDNLDQVQVQELLLFNFEKPASATNNFQQSNKLGQGGFGPIYWVMVAHPEVSCLIIWISS